ncbi:ABC transporter ATP-binding protein [Epibacterium sp. MM17-32]|uniref:ABC transporter ATP-binding protein n=1 Tax=Epibacterium sp. MM17-32 TaxID=2917734 RepID=UPI001EF48073|nr:ABC transporter ATP-binding protein [Epibacterium sp. MM17-32]MCG7626559.1 ABC transporter ATP-binding protein [Epibacterium sp. MM17-32]
MLLRVQDLTRRYPGQTRAVLQGAGFELDRGESVALTGESGSGKSTLLHMLAALDQPDAGQILLDGADISRLDDRTASAVRRRRIALVFQHFNLIPALTVAENIALHARLGKCHEAEWTNHLAERMGLADLMRRYPEQISGGQQQRVAIARALALRPDVLLADEPTGNLDEYASEEVLRLMLELVSEAGSALLLVTHSQQIAARCQRHLHLSGGQITEGACA